MDILRLELISIYRESNLSLLDFSNATQIPYNQLKNYIYTDKDKLNENKFAKILDLARKYKKSSSFQSIKATENLNETLDRWRKIISGSTRLSDSKLAEYIGVDGETIRRWVHGIAKPRFNTICKIEEKLKVGAPIDTLTSKSSVIAILDHWRMLAFSRTRISNEKLGVKIGVSANLIGEWTKGKKKPTFETIFRINEVLHNDHNANSNLISIGTQLLDAVRAELGENLKAKAEFVRIAKLAKDQLGVCLSSEYFGNRTPLLFKCKLGHEWSTTPHSIKRGVWCPTCAHIKK